MGRSISLCACGKKKDRQSERCNGCRLERLKERHGPIADVARGPQTYDEALALYRQYIGQTTPPPPPSSKRPKFSDERIVIASDFHAPFQRMDVLADLMAVEADTMIIGGDLQDHYSISRFLKFENVPMSQEIAAAQLILEQASHNFASVLCIEGNHDSQRFVKLLADRLPHSAIDIIRFLSKTGNLSTMEVLVGQFRNVELMVQKIGSHRVGWFAQKGDLLVSHAEKFSRVPGSTVRSVEEWFSDFEDVLGLDSWRVIAQAHTHAMSWFPLKANRVVFELGCMCHVHGYQLEAKAGGRPQRNGWVTLTQRDGVTDLTSICPHLWQPKEKVKAA